ncbi:MAG: FeoA family protein [Calditrichia bacterium]
MLPLGLLTSGETAEVVVVKHNQKKSMNMDCCKQGHHQEYCRMEELGIRPGRKITMLTNDGGKSLIVKVENSRIALGRGIAMKIYVRR